VNDRIPLKFRLLGALLHLLCMMPAALVVVRVVAWSEIVNKVKQIFPQETSTQTLTDIYIHQRIWIPIIIAILGPLIAMLMWAITRKIHTSIDRFGRDALNCGLSSLLAILLSFVICCSFTLFVLLTICGPFAILLLTQPLEVWITNVSGFSGIISIPYFINSVVSGVFALRGYRFKSRLIYPFVRDL
jgi:uncharacterized Tic20 family protein